MLEPNHVHHAEVIRVVDGDTFIARVELDFRVKVDITVRVRGYSTPELNTLEGQVAAHDLAVRLSMCKNRVMLLSYKDTMSFSRWVCDVWIEGVQLRDL
jgi:endonuclease YncB( thermonuclease family)